ncbi:MAG: putative CAMK/CAMK1 protein kinase, partial [Streblomastix strix]
MGKDQKKYLTNLGFKVLNSLGKGKFGHVYKVFKKETMSILAAKVIRRYMYDNQEWEAGRIIEKLKDDPHVLKYFQKIESEKYIVILMESSNFGSLQDLIDMQIDLDISMIRSIFKQFLEILRTIHSVGIIHRDLKGANILFHSPPGSGQVYLKVIDFGTVVILKDTEAATLMSCRGSQKFMPPEMFKIHDLQYQQFLGDHKIDVWSAGIIMFNLISHQYPYQAAEQQNIDEFQYKKILVRPISIKNDDLWDLISNLLQFNPSERFSAEQALQHQFFKYDKSNFIQLSNFEKILDINLKSRIFSLHSLILTAANKENHELIIAGGLQSAVGYI